jgi:hypothetical protein
MMPQHWLMIILALAAGYVLARFYPQVGQMAGLP